MSRGPGRLPPVNARALHHVPPPERLCPGAASRKKELGTGLTLFLGPVALAMTPLGPQRGINAASPSSAQASGPRRLLLPLHLQPRWSLSPTSGPTDLEAGTGAWTDVSSPCVALGPAAGEHTGSGADGAGSAVESLSVAGALATLILCPPLLQRGPRDPSGRQL